MNKPSLFIVIEGLDGSGKTSVSRRVVEVLETAHRGKVKFTYEPHDPSCAGLFIRQVLTKKITNFTPRILALAFAANRLDHCDREIIPWLEADGPCIVISDRYYLSSLVYQSAPDFPFASVMKLNEKALRPDLVFFLNVSNEVCYQRMKHRNQPQELFEKDLSETRDKYHGAMQFLQEQHCDRILEIDGGAPIETVAEQILEAIYEFAPAWRPEESFLPEEGASNAGILEGDPDISLETAAESVLKRIDQEKLKALEPDARLATIKQAVAEQVDDYGEPALVSLFLSWADSLGYTTGKPLSGTSLPAWELAYLIPPDLQMRGAALFLPEPQSVDLILKAVPELSQLSDFLLVLVPGPPELVLPYYEREVIQFNAGNRGEGLFPVVRMVSRWELEAGVVERAEENLFKS